MTVLVVVWVIIIITYILSFFYRDAVDSSLAGCLLITAGMILQEMFHKTEQRDVSRQGFCPLISLSDLNFVDKIRLTIDSQLCCSGLGLLLISIF